MEKELNDEAVGYLKELIEHGHKHGLEIPKKLKDHMRSTPWGRQFELDSRLSAREKVAARKKAKAEADDEFFERTGIRNKAEDWNLDTLVA